jgi:hypothetical protein
MTTQHPLFSTGKLLASLAAFCYKQGEVVHQT